MSLKLIVSFGKKNLLWIWKILHLQTHESEKNSTNCVEIPDLSKTNTKKVKWLCLLIIAIHVFFLQMRHIASPECAQIGDIMLN